jgi:hypothetical protein
MEDLSRNKLIQKPIQHATLGGGVFAPKIAKLWFTYLLRIMHTSTNDRRYYCRSKCEKIWMWKLRHQYL